MQSELASSPARQRQSATQSLHATAVGTAANSSSLAVRMADVFTVREVLRLRMAVGQSADGDRAAEYYWVELLRDCAEADVLEAAWDHYRGQSRPLWPADILDWVRAESLRRRETTAGRRELELEQRMARGWGGDALARWTPVFDLEIARGGTPDAAAQAADLSVEL